MVRRSSRRGVALAKAKALQSRMLLDAPDHKVLAGALPKVDEVLSAKLVKQKETALPRTALALKRPRRQEPNLFQTAISKTRRQILFLNVGDDRIMEAIQALTMGTEAPPWMRYLNGISVQKGRLVLRENGRALPFALNQEKRNLVKDLYYNPKEPSTIQPITDKLRTTHCNISRSNVRNILRSLETYQLMFPRRLQPKIQHQTLYTKPGVIAMDTFFPSKNSGWKYRKGGVLCCMDVWSRFSRAYALDGKEKRFFKKRCRHF